MDIKARILEKLGSFTRWFNARSAAINQVADLDDLSLLSTYAPNREERRMRTYAHRQRCDIWAHTLGRSKTRASMNNSGIKLRGN